MKALAECNMKTLIIIPAYNEAQKIRSVVAGLVKRGYEVLVVNDCSIDATEYEARAGGAHVVNHFINRGYGAALGTGNAYALKHGYDIAVHFDADGQHNPDEISDLIKPILDEQADFTIGSRFLKAHDTIPFIRKQLIKVAVTFTWIISGVKLTDAHNGFRALSRTAFKTIECQQDGMSYASEIIDQVGEHTLRLREVPNSIVYTDYSKSKGEGNIKKIFAGFRFLWSKIIG